MFGISRAGSFGPMFSILAKTRPALELTRSGGRMTPSWVFNDQIYGALCGYLRLQLSFFNKKIN